MARKNNNQTGDEGSGWEWLFWIFLAIMVVAAIFFVSDWMSQHNTGGWIADTAESIWELFGWGLLFILLAVITFIFLIARKKFTSLFRHWNRWLGAIAVIFAAWGILAFYQLGGTVGLGIIGEPANWDGIPLAGIFRVAGLFILGFFLIFPKLLMLIIRGIRKAIARRREKRRQQLAARPVVYKEVQPKRKELEPGVEPEKASASVTELSEKKTKPAKEPAAAANPKGLKQIAQDVWKKYGQSAGVKIVDGWKLPPIDILDDTAEKEYGQADNVQRARRIEEALKSYGVDAKVVQINAGPTVTQFGIEPGWDIKTHEVRDRDKDGNVQTRIEEISRMRVKVERITNLGNDLALALAASSIRFEAPVPGKSIIGIEVPNTVSDTVSLRGVIETSTFQKMAAKSKLAIGLGKGAGGEAGAGDLAKMPHLLIAGATGSGKTVCLNASICCLLMQNTPDDLRFIMIDPKRVELTSFNSIPHLAVPVIVNTDKALEAMRWLELEMDKRYQQLAKASARNIDGYNKNRTGKSKMPFLVLIIDELADLMMTGSDEVERILCRLAQLARAVGIHLIVATQRPSVDVVTGLIKANFPTRLSFAVTSQVDSRTILDTVGAEKLLGRGDMLYMPTEEAKPKRLQGCYVSDPEIERLVYFWGSQKAEELSQIKIEAVPASAVPGSHEPPKDPLLETARKLSAEHEQISTSYLQRKLQVGYPRAARLKELLDEERETAEKTNTPPAGAPPLDVVDNPEQPTTEDDEDEGSQP
jgi:DNA segregation ATPase FtsK/SpoIIIE, S-DNA-T family